MSVAPRDALSAIGQLADVEIDIGGAALQLARIDAPDADWRAAERQLSALAREAVALAGGLRPGDVGGRAAALAGLLTGEHGYRGDIDSYDDLANANLIRVIERRRGLPVALGILWLHCARAAGWGAHGLDFPGHFLLGLETEPPGRRHQPLTAQQLVIDVFIGGVPLEAADLRTLFKHVAGASAELTPGLLQPMSTRRVLLRLQENIRLRRLQAGDTGGALACTQDMLLLAPDMAQLWRDAALMQEQLGHVEAAIACHERVVRLLPAHPAARHAQDAIERLRSS